MTIHFPLSLTLLLISFLHQNDAQISAMFGNAVQAENCGEWTPWGPCIWLKGDGGDGRSARWDRPYFEQLLPGRTGCRHHVFFKLLRDKWGEAFNNFYQYLREITLSDRQCGECSYQQSCGRNCYKRGPVDKMNPLFVAERRCPNIDQSDACVSRRVNADCRLWPTPTHVQLPNVTEAMREVIAGMDYLSCVPEQRGFGDVVCRCCCHPFAPNPANGYKCELKAYLKIESTTKP